MTRTRFHRSSAFPRVCRLYRRGVVISQMDLRRFNGLSSRFQRPLLINQCPPLASIMSRHSAEFSDTVFAVRSSLRFSFAQQKHYLLPILHRDTRIRHRRLLIPTVRFACCSERRGKLCYDLPLDSDACLSLPPNDHGENTGCSGMRPAFLQLRRRSSEHSVLHRRRLGSACRMLWNAMDQYPGV